MTKDSLEVLVVPFNIEETPEQKKLREKYWNMVVWRNYMMYLMFRK